MLRRKVRVIEGAVEGPVAVVDLEAPPWRVISRRHQPKPFRPHNSWAYPNMRMRSSTDFGMRDGSGATLSTKVSCSAQFDLGNWSFQASTGDEAWPDHAMSSA